MDRPSPRPIIQYDTLPLDFKCLCHSLFKRFGIRQEMEPQTTEGDKPKRKSFCEENGVASKNEISSSSSRSPTNIVENDSSRPTSANLDKNNWEIVEGLKEGQKYEKEPEKYDGFLMKRRKWPMKGWHKRYFVLNKGELRYAKTPSDVARGKLHGSVDVGLSVLAIMTDSRRIDLDTEESIYHLKAKTRDSFDKWVAKLRSHRLYRQHQLQFGSKRMPNLVNIASPSTDHFSSPLLAEARRRQSLLRQDLSRSRSSTLQSQTSLGHERVAAWLSDSANLNQCNKELTALQSSVFHLTSLLQELQQLPLLDELDVPASSKKSRRLSFGKGKGKKKVPEIPASSDRLQLYYPMIRSYQKLSATEQSLRLSSSNPNLPDINIDDPEKNDGSNHRLFRTAAQQKEHENKVREEFITTANEVHKNMRGLLHTMTTEREKMQQALEQEFLPANKQIHLLQSQLKQACAQNTELRERLQRIFLEADLSKTAMFATPKLEELQPKDIASPMLLRDQTHERSMSVSDVGEFFDAQEYLASSSSSSEAAPSDEDELDSSLISDDDLDDNSEETLDIQSQCPSSVVENEARPSYSMTGRRSKLPVPKPDTGDFSLWNLLKKNIGKDLSKVSMPVTLNEPLSMLQRLCEEMEYSDLLDKACVSEDPHNRMVLVAAFAVSSYAASQFRAGQKPFNPLLGETYEAVRDDRGFKFVAEQVSHHPPISACHCESENYILWQDIRIKTKFWGKSMEFQPVGLVNLTIPKYNDHYRWNKVTTCVHNILSGQRWVDQYGEMIIKNGSITCKLTFAKASYFSNKRYEVYGSIFDSGKVVHHLFGKWTEGLYCGVSGSAKCIWRPGAMPEDYDLYYGFTRFATELNELNTTTKHLLPPTDSRFRTDQRMMEEGNVEAAEREKARIENLQRNRRKKREEENITYEPLFFRKETEHGKECWVSNGNYWKLREDPGFSNMEFTKLW
ncbi:oxysterol-binding protein-related protein 6-like isoform X2 [Ptychodera flava]|uniref:oxysterol-binding protein-related protein 6-like isoform X2 n=1 Tax=Ptychodera flava TaxID=63121 RepID=UPI00396A6DE9